MPEEKRQLMLNVFSRLSQRVVWKWEAGMDDAPANVRVWSWLPQPALLAHPATRVFLTHGGAGSVQEALCHRTPIVGVPISGDQPANVQLVVDKGAGVQVGWQDLTEESLAAALDSVLGDPRYQQAATRLSDLILDQPQHPLDRAVWWLEYLLRHPGNPGMLSPTHKLYWFQYFLLDILSVVLFVLLLLSFMMYKLCYCCFRKKEKIE